MDVGREPLLKLSEGSIKTFSVLGMQCQTTSQEKPVLYLQVPLGQTESLGI